MRLLLAFVLLTAQLGVTAHAYAHFSSAGDQSGAPVDTVQPCAQCQSGSSLLSAAAASGHHFELQPSGSDPALHSRSLSLIEARPTVAFRSRAPPALL